MYTSLSTWYPIPGKEAEMLAQGTEFVTAHQARGEQYALLTRLYSAIGPVVTVARHYRDMAEAEAALATNRADPDFQTALARASAISRAPTTQRLHEYIVPPRGTGEVKYVQSTLIHPALGNNDAVRSLLSEWVTSEQAKRSIGLGVDLYDPDGTIFVVNVAYPSLSAVEEARRANQEDKAFQKAAAEVSRLCRRPAAMILAAMVVGFPQ